MSISGLSNSYLENVCQSVLKNQKFLGVYPCDIQPSVCDHKKAFSIIFNTGDSKTRGKHFVAIYINKKYLYYFDSFGEIPMDNNIKKFIKENQKRRKIINFNFQIQSDSSSFCGFYCLAFLLSKDRRKYSLFKKMMNRKNLLKNDVVVISFIVKHI